MAKVDEAPVEASAETVPVGSPWDVPNPCTVDGRQVVGGRYIPTRPGEHTAIGSEVTVTVTAV